MMSSHSFGPKEYSFLCSSHLSQSRLPKSPCPELLFNNFVPTVSQIQEIVDVIGGREEELSHIDNEMAQLQLMIDRLRSRRAELQNFVKSHRSVISAIRRLPSEILCEIFSHCVDLTCAAFDFTNPLSDIIRVCYRWRSVALGFPLLWRHVFLDIRIFKAVGSENTGIPRRVSLQLERSRQEPLSMHLDIGSLYTSLDLLEILLAVSPRWWDVSLRLSSPQLKQLMESKANFPNLRQFTLKFWMKGQPPLWGPADVGRFFESLPALEDLSLHHVTWGAIPCNLIPWSRLHTCTLFACEAKDIPPILPLFSPNAQVRFEWCTTEHGLRMPPTQSAICALSFTSCHDKFVTDLLGAITAPSLKRLAIWGYGRVGLVALLTTFLRRSSGALAHIGIGFPTHLADVCVGELLKLLDLPQVRQLVDLEIDCNPMAMPIVDALATRDILPNLRSLALRNSHRPKLKLDQACILSMHARRWPVLRSLWLESPTDPSLSQTLLALKSGGLEVVKFKR